MYRGVYRYLYHFLSKLVEISHSFSFLFFKNWIQMLFLNEVIKKCTKDVQLIGLKLESLDV